MIKEIPSWVQDDIKKAKFAKPEPLTRMGYILEIYNQDMKIDAQLYDAVEDGRRIVTMDLPKKINPSDLMKGLVYEFAFNAYKAPLNKKLIEFLKNEMEVEMDAIYQFELTNFEPVDIDSTSDTDEPEE